MTAIADGILRLAMLFRSIRERWGATRGPQLQSELDQILGHVERLPTHLRPRFVSMVTVSMAELEKPFSQRSRREQIRIIKKARNKTRRPRSAPEMADAMGLALVHTYLEATITPGIPAAQVEVMAMDEINRILHERT